jgi:hypothetical protein
MTSGVAASEKDCMGMIHERQVVPVLGSARFTVKR